MKILGIESSCDETAAAVVSDDGTVLSEVVASQIKEHAPFGGVVPEIASRAHLRAIVPCINQVLKEVGGIDAVDGIAFTQGPGLIGALLVGVQTAKALAFARGLPMMGVDHLQGHLFASFLTKKNMPNTIPRFPYVALLVSGGHTALYEVHDFDRIHLLGQTRDDAAGEAYDKVAKLLGLGYPGGPILDRLAQQGDAKAVLLPRPMHAHPHIEFSFSGLKTAVMHHVREAGVPSTDQGLRDLAASFQAAVCDVLVSKSLLALQNTGCRDLVITGGVAANQGLQNAARHAIEGAGLSLHMPPRAWCTDNAAMIAYVGAQKLLRGKQSPWNAAPYSQSSLGQKFGS